MCGIFGTIHFQAPQPGVVLSALAHRGPDEQNHLAGERVSLYHTRLAIQDLTPSGRQPMQHNGVYITFNGEIYNHWELRKKYGLSSASRSDTMTLLLLYEALGTAMFETIDGMFALAIHDTANGKLLLARDRAGKKPLYLWSRGRSLAFSSELNALKDVVRPSLDEASIADYLYLGYHFRAATPYREIEELEAGTFLEVDLDTLDRKKVRWFDIADAYSRPLDLTPEEALAGLDERLHLAVQRRIDSSDLEVGSFLSGGIDSGLVTAIASAYTKDLKTFTVKMPGAYDESVLAQSVAEKYGTRHTTIEISFDGLRDDFTRIVSNYGEPFFDSSAIPSYYVSQEARKHITVVLNGDGADELFGGYRRYMPFRYYDFFGRKGPVSWFARTAGNLLPPGHRKQDVYTYVYRLLKFAGYKELTDIYGGATTDLFTGYKNEFETPPRLQGLTELLDRVSRLPVSSLSKILIADFDTILFSDLLVKMDIATMAHSLEGRSPFLSKELLEFAPTLKDGYKIRGRRSKVLLRSLAGRYLPEALIDQPKRGFEIPLKDWMNGVLGEMTEDYLFGSAGALYPTLIRKSFVTDVFKRKVNLSEERRAKMLYALLCLEVWYKRVYQHG
ncbi:asparagine synthase (glutamine-hydrolyzing) [Dinghuibacter silviterrae]|uniref:asparagine synthase (glutamine-hydrolyzing) n=1 Tax=Dinghuibacter silviterrae TaxID=1539049 RepID=A0A4R8DQI4_9BACT|nr:asparagine synthase (glutamine-hydrolyzing) [Dinghuibacter silviterrae]TDX00046.1 asparagine synthase (glutamine-hydrolysing) [Dinghuibacter silviterrae]